MARTLAVASRCQVGPSGLDAVVLVQIENVIYCSGFYNFTEPNMVMQIEHITIDGDEMYHTEDSVLFHETGERLRSGLVRTNFLTAMATEMGCHPAVVGEVGVTVLGHPDRAESQVTAGYRLGEHLVVTCDPAVEAMLQVATAGMQPTLEAWRSVAVGLGGEFLGSGRMQLLTSVQAIDTKLPDEFHLRSLDRDNSDDHALIERLIDTSDSVELDDAEIELDSLDETIEVVIAPNGEIAAFASGRPFDMAPGFGDIGIFTRVEHRGLGVGTAVVAALCPRLRAAGLEPLYRCDEDNEGSVKLSAAVGFEPVLQLSAYRFSVG